MTLAAGAALLLLLQARAGAEEAGSASSGKDWPCKQILVPQISLPAVWAGPPIEDMDWRHDGAVADLVAKIAARKTPMEAAEQDINSFAAAAGADKQAKLTALFAGVFESLNHERTEIIDGLFRFGRKQKALAAKIRAENAELQKSPDASSPGGPDTATTPLAQRLELDLRLYDEGRRSLSFACESPTLIDQRMFALARSIQNNLD